MSPKPPTVRISWFVLGLSAGSALLGASCSAGGERQGQLTGETRQAILGGETDSEHTAVLAIATITASSQALCTGTLIAPNLVLTARHCVVPTESQLVDCTDSTFAAPYGPSNLWVSPSTDVRGSDLFPVREVGVPRDDGALCGADIALLILNGQFSDRITPMAPRLDQPAERGEPFTAVGFGSALDDGSAGTRRWLDGLEVVCGPDDCGAPEVLTKTEFVGEQGVCEGDSGGPALDADGEIVGVASRTGEGCGWAVYSAVAPWRDWIVEVATAAAALGDYESPRWLTSAVALDAALGDVSDVLPTDDVAATTSGAVNDVGSGTDDIAGNALPASTREASGCSVGGANGGDTSRGVALGALALSLVGLSRRRRASA